MMAIVQLNETTRTHTACSNEVSIILIQIRWYIRMQYMKFQTNDGLDRFSLSLCTVVPTFWCCRCRCRRSIFHLIFALFCDVLFCFDFNCHHHRNVHTHNLFQFSLFMALPFQMTIHFSLALIALIFRIHMRLCVCLCCCFLRYRNGSSSQSREESMFKHWLSSKYITKMANILFCIHLSNHRCVVFFSISISWNKKL